MSEQELADPNNFIELENGKYQIPANTYKESIEKLILEEGLSLEKAKEETIKEWKLAHPAVPKAQEKTLPSSNSAKRLIDLNKGHIGQF